MDRREFLTAISAPIAGALLYRLSRKDTFGPPAPERRLARLVIHGDAHMGYPDYDRKARIARDDINESVKPDYVIFIGDFTTNGTQKEYDKALSLIREYRARVWALMGNHEFWNSPGKANFPSSDPEMIDRFRRAFPGLPPYSSHVIANRLHVVLLSQEAYASVTRGNPDRTQLSVTQLQWLDTILRDHRELPTIICIHAPLRGTVFWSGGSAGVHPEWGDFGRVEQDTELKGILARNPQVKIIFSGHTHVPHEVPQQTVLYRDPGWNHAVWCVGCAATSHLLYEPRKFDNTHYVQTRVLDLYDYRIEVRVRDHTGRAWKLEPRISLYI